MIPTVVAVPSRFYPEKLLAVYDMVADDLGPDDRFIVLDNGLPECPECMIREARPVPLSQMQRIGLWGRPLYSMWSAAWRRALDISNGGPCNLAILNDDITILPGTITAMAEALRSDDRWWLISADYERSTADGEAEVLREWDHWLDEYEGPTADGLALGGVREVHGTYRHGGVAGWCWMVRAEKHYDGLLAAWEWEDYEVWAGDDELVAQIERLGGHVGIVSGLPVDHEGEASVSRRPELADAKGRDLARFRKTWGARS